MRIMALDVGEKRIGIAITDKSNKVSLPLLTIENNFSSRHKIFDLIKEYEIGRIIVGMPYNLKGQKGFQSKKVMDFVDDTFKEIKIPVIMMDERFTTRISAGRMDQKIFTGPDGKCYKKNKKITKIKDIDMIAASIILGDYLERVENEKQ